MRTFSISAGLDAVTLTLGMLAPEVSFTIPSIVLCAEAKVGNSIKPTTTTANLALVIPVLPIDLYD